MVRKSAVQPGWIPPDAGLVDHLFLLFGLVESLEPNFFADRMFPALATGDYNADGTVDSLDYALWRATFGSQTRLAADGNSDGRVDAADFVVWRIAAGSFEAGLATTAPEPNTATTMLVLTLCSLVIRAGRRRAYNGLC
jgi:hypothetical protein